MQHFIRILCWFAPRFPSPLLPFIQFCLSAAFLRFLSPVKSLEASRRGRERRLVTFPSRPLFLSYTHAVPRPHGHILARESTVETRTQVHRIFSLFTPATTLPFPVQRVRRVSRCILMKKFVTSLRHPAAASAKRRRRKGGGLLSLPVYQTAPIPFPPSPATLAFAINEHTVPVVVWSSRVHAYSKINFNQTAARFRSRRTYFPPSNPDIARLPRSYRFCPPFAELSFLDAFLDDVSLLRL